MSRLSAARSELLSPILRQNEAIRHYMRGRRGGAVLDVDPETGEPEVGPPAAGSGAEGEGTGADAGAGLGYEGRPMGAFGGSALSGMGRRVPPSGWPELIRLPEAAAHTFRSTSPGSGCSTAPT